MKKFRYVEGNPRKKWKRVYPSRPPVRLIPDVKAPPGLRTLFANRFAPTDFSIVSGRRNARLDRTPYGMLIHIVQILFLRDLNSSNEKTITRTPCRCLHSDSIDSSSPPTLSALFYVFCSLFAIVTTSFHPPFVSSSKETGVFCVWGYVENRI